MVNSSLGVHSNYIDRLHVGGIAPDSAEFISHTAEEVQEVLGTLDASDRHLKDRSLQILSFTSCVSLFTGLIASIKGIREYILGTKIANTTAKLRGASHFMAGSSEVMAGGAYVGMTGAMINHYITAGHVAHVAAEHLEHIGSGLVGCSTFFYAIYWGIELLDLIDVREKIDSAFEKDADVFSMIRKAIKDPKYRLQWEKALGKELLHKIMDNQPVDLDEVNIKVNDRILKALCYSLLSVGAAIATGLILSSIPIVAPWIFSAIGAGLGIIWLISDVNNLKECLKEKVMNWEKSWIYFSTLFCLAAITASLWASKEVLTYALTLAIGVALFIVHYLAISKIQSNEPAHT